MTLYEARKGCGYTINGLFVEPTITRRLQALGLNDGTAIRVLNRKKHGALIIQVRGTRLALGKHISSNIEIKEIKENKDLERQESENLRETGDLTGTKQQKTGNLQETGDLQETRRQKTEESCREEESVQKGGELS